MKVLREYFGYFISLVVIWLCWIFWGPFKHFRGFGDIISHFGEYQASFFFIILEVREYYDHFGRLGVFYSFEGIEEYFGHVRGSEYFNHFGAFKAFWVILEVLKGILIILEI